MPRLLDHAVGTEGWQNYGVHAASDTSSVDQVLTPFTASSCSAAAMRTANATAFLNWQPASHSRRHAAPTALTPLPDADPEDFERVENGAIPTIKADDPGAAPLDPNGPPRGPDKYADASEDSPLPPPKPSNVAEQDDGPLPSGTKARNSRLALKLKSDDVENAKASDAGLKKLALS